MKTALSFVVAALAALSVRAAAVGVEVDGIPLDSGGTSDAGWAYDPATSNLTLFGAGPFTLSGTNTAGEVRVCIPAGVTNRVTLAGLALEVESGRAAGVFRLEAGADVALTVAGTNSLCGGDGHAGLRVPPGASLALTNASADAVLTVQGGFLGAGLGGDERGGCGAVRIDGGTVVARGGTSGAGLGGGYRGAGGSVSIRGGRLTADGGRYAAGIGGGAAGRGGEASVSGGTVSAVGGENAMDVGPGANSSTGGPAIFSGGSVRLAHGLANLAPSNRTDRVWHVAVGGNTPDAPVAVAGLVGYGTDGIVADEDGAIHLWLPSGVHTFFAGATAYRATVGADGAVALVRMAGVTVNGVDAFSGPGTGWSYDAASSNLTLFGAGPFTLAGLNRAGEVRVRVPAGAEKTVRLVGLDLAADVADACAFRLEAGASAVLTLAGENSLLSGENCAGLQVPAGSGIAITNAPGARGSLSARGGLRGAGIGGGNGGGNGGAAGAVTIRGGIVSAAGGLYGAGIGGGSGGAAGTVTIRGGTVTAVGDVENIARDVGNGSGGPAGGTHLFLGGSADLVYGRVVPSPSNGVALVRYVKVGGLAPNVPVKLDGLAGYGTDGIFSDANGRIHLWLPDGSYRFSADDGVEVLAYEADVVSDLSVTVRNVGVLSTGVTVDGIDAAAGSGTGWTYDFTASALTLSGAGPFTLGGANRKGRVRVVIPAGTTNAVTLSGLHLSAAENRACSFLVSQDACVALSLAGLNTLQSGRSRSGIQMQAGSSLSVTNAPQAGMAMLSVQGGAEGSGIGHSYDTSQTDIPVGGNVTIGGGIVQASGGNYGAGIGGLAVAITGGSVTATGGRYAAGIGGIRRSEGSVGALPDLAVAVSGGTVVAAGGEGGAGIGSGRCGEWVDVSVTGGRVTATGGARSAGIGGGRLGAGACVTISGGTVVATGGAGSGTPDVGCDPASANAGRAATNLFTGGSIRLAQVLADPAPSNRVSRVWCVTMSGLAPNTPVTFAGLPADYGTNDIMADEDGHAYLWLPNGDYAFSANGRSYGAAVQDGGALAEGAAANPSALWIGSFALSGRRATLGFRTDLGAAAFSRWIASGGASQLFVYFVETLDADTATDIAPDGIVDGADGTATLTATLPAGATGFLQLVLYDDE